MRRFSKAFSARRILCAYHSSGAQTPLLESKSYSKIYCSLSGGPWWYTGLTRLTLVPAEKKSFLQRFSRFSVLLQMSSVLSSPDKDKFLGTLNRNRFLFLAFVKLNSRSSAVLVLLTLLRHIYLKLYLPFLRKENSISALNDSEKLTVQPNSIPSMGRPQRFLWSPWYSCSPPILRRRLKATRNWKTPDCNIILPWDRSPQRSAKLPTCALAFLNTFS